MLSAKQWKSQKARTLVGETVTKSLTQVHDAALKLQVKTKEPVQLTALTAYSGALKSLQVEIVKTRGKCKKGLHDETIKNLEAMERDAKDLYAQAQKAQVEFNNFLKGFNKVKADGIAALESVLKTPTSTTVKQAQQVLSHARDWTQNAEKVFGSAEIEAVMQQLVSAGLVIDRVAKDLADRAPRVPGARTLPATPADLAGPLAEIRQQLVKLKTPGGFYGQQFKKDVTRTLDLS